MRKIYFLLSVLCLSTLFTSCKDDEKEGFGISPKNMNLVVEQTGTIKVDGGVSGCQFSSGNKYIASVKNDGVVTALRVGETQITVKNENNSTANCKIKVTGKANMYTEPYLKFGASISQVKSFEKRTFARQEEDYIYYKGENKYVEEVAYSFKNKQLIGSVVLIPGTFTNADLLGRFIAERYVVIKIEKDDIYFMTTDETVMGGITTGYIGMVPYCLVAYVSAVPANKSGNMDVMYIKKKINEIKIDMKL